MNVLLGVTGSVGAKLTGKLVNEFKDRGHDVKCIGTDSAMEFTRMLETQHDEFVEYEETGRVLHVEYAQWADVYVICPCTSNTFNKILNGVSDNIVLSTLRAFDDQEKKLYVAPVMNTEMLKKDMWNISDVRRGYSKIKMEIIWPATKMLACGDYGLGAMANIEDIVRVVEGVRWKVPWKFCAPGIFNYNRIKCGMGIRSIVDHPGWFGSQRKYDIHSGVDLYCGGEVDVYPFEPGVVVNMGLFTGEDAGCGWWNDSYFVAIKGESGVIVYGEIMVDGGISIGDNVGVDCIIGNVTRILKNKPKSQIIGHSMYMLHVELLNDGEVEPCEGWKKGSKCPKGIKDPSIYIALAEEI